MFLYHYEYMKLIFDLSLWEKEAVAVLVSTLAALYATILICVYATSVFTEFLKFPENKVNSQWIVIVSFFFSFFLLSNSEFLNLHF